MSQIAVKYKLLEPKSRPDPFVVSPSITFKKGICILVVEHDTVDIVDKTLRAYGAERVKEEGDGKGSVQTDGSLGVGETDEGGDNRAELGSEALGSVDGSVADQGLEGNSGSETPGADGSSAAVPVVEPVAKLTKAEAKAGLDLQQAAYFRLSGGKDPVEWLAAYKREEAAKAEAQKSNEDDLV